MMQSDSLKVFLGFTFSGMNFLGVFVGDSQLGFHHPEHKPCFLKLLCHSVLTHQHLTLESLGSVTKGHFQQQNWFSNYSFRFAIISLKIQ